MYGLVEGVGGYDLEEGGGCLIQGRGGEDYRGVRSRGGVVCICQILFGFIFIY